MAVAGVGARTDGVNLFPPVGLTFFSVAVGDVSVGATDVVVVVVVDDGLGVELLPQAALNPISAMSPAPPASAGRRLVKLPVFMDAVLSISGDWGSGGSDLRRNRTHQLIRVSVWIN
jgi:hypothetical protein